MNKLTILFVFTASFLIGACSNMGTKKDAIPALLESKTISALKEETDNIKATYDKAALAIKTNPGDLKQYLTLATVYIVEGRITGNSTYYSNAAGKVLDKVISSGTSDKDILFQAYSLKSAVLLNMHQFKDALVEAQLGVTISSYNAGIYGALVDANVELGNYDTAVADCDEMLSIRPDLRSYSRASYLRQIYGDNRGAIDAMKLAVEAGVPGAENTEWARVTLGDLYLNIGKVDSAAITYRTSLVYRPGYVYAEMGLAKACKAKNNYDEAITHTKNAINIMSEAAFVSFLGDLYQLKGDEAKAKEVHNDVLDLLRQGQKEEDKDAVIKHNVNREMATAYMNVGDLNNALQYATKDLSMRPDNIDANELVAWIYFLNADYANAKIYADRMLHMNTKNANTLFKASAIYAKLGDMQRSVQLKQQADTINPYLDQKIVWQANAANSKTAMK